MERSHLATDIVTDHFGDVIGKVAGALVMRDRLLIHEIERVTELEFLQVKNSLLVLIQHNLVSFIEEYELGNRENVQTYYQANIALMLWRLRFPRFLQVAKHRFGEEGQLMVQMLLEHGRLTHDLILQHAAQSAGFEISDTMLKELIRQRFVVRVPEAPGPQAAADVTSQLTAARRAKPGGGAGGDEDDDDDDGSGVRSGLSNLSEGYREAKPKKRKSRGNASADHQPKRQNVDPLSGRMTDVYWCINPERFNMHFRHEAIIKMVEEKVDATAGTYIRVMFKMIEPYIHSLSDNDSVSVSTTELWQELKKEYSSDDITQHSVLQYLNVMVGFASLLLAEQSILRKTSDVEPCAFAISLLGLSEFLQAKVIESVVQQRFGDLSLRIFRLLRMKKQLEQKGIADLALIPVPETRERLYKMLSCEFVHLQEVPRTADHAPARTFYLWSVRMEQIKRHVVNEIYAVLRKMRQRLHHEEIFSPDLERTKPPSDTEIHRIMDKLDNAILQLDNSLMVLTDFGRERKEE